MEDVNKTRVKGILFRILIFVLIANIISVVIWTTITAFFPEANQAFLHGIGQLVMIIVPLVMFLVMLSLWYLWRSGGGFSGDGDGGGDGGGFSGDGGGGGACG